MPATYYVAHACRHKSIIVHGGGGVAPSPSNLHLGAVSGCIPTAPTSAAAVSLRLQLVQSLVRLCGVSAPTRSANRCARQTENSTARHAHLLQ